MTLQEIIKSLESLSKEDENYLFEILRQRSLDAYEKEILANAQELKEAIKHGTAKVGTIEDLIADLNESEA
jgi:hypothetical protein